MKYFYECGICGALHSAAWDGDCREEGAGFSVEELDAKFGTDGWVEVPMPTWEDADDGAIREGEVGHEQRI